jgi:hypothetical protein
MASDPPKVLIRYSHDSPEHRDRVLVLSKHLRKDGIDLHNRPICGDAC